MCIAVRARRLVCAKVPVSKSAMPRGHLRLHDFQRGGRHPLKWSEAVLRLPLRHRRRAAGALQCWFPKLQFDTPLATRGRGLRQESLHLSLGAFNKPTYHLKKASAPINWEGSLSHFWRSFRLYQLASALAPMSTSPANAAHGAGNSSRMTHAGRWASIGTRISDSLTCRNSNRTAQSAPKACRIPNSRLLERCSSERPVAARYRSLVTRPAPQSSRLVSIQEKSLERR